MVDDSANARKSKTQILYEQHSLTAKQSMALRPFWELWLNNLLYTVALMWLTVMTTRVQHV